MNYADGDFFEGFFKDGAPNGPGLMIYKGQEQIKGMFANGVPVNHGLEPEETGKPFKTVAMNND
jgi:hypothetical protein